MDPGRYVIPSLVSTSTGTDHSGFAYYYILCLYTTVTVTVIHYKEDNTIQYNAMQLILCSAGAPAPPI